MAVARSGMHWSLEASIRAGRADEAHALMKELVASSQQEPGTRGYEWFIAGNGIDCHIYERYADSEGALAHLRNFKDNFSERFIACFEQPSMKVYGEPNAELKRILDNFGASYYTMVAGFNN